jgi:hypothetical protein
MVQNERLTYAWSAKQRVPFAQKSTAFINRIIDNLPMKMVRKVKKKRGDEVWPWDREELQLPKASPQGAKCTR